jgi:hypothetical protein
MHPLRQCSRSCLLGLPPKRERRTAFPKNNRRKRCESVGTCVPHQFSAPACAQSASHPDAALGLLEHFWTTHNRALDFCCIAL